MERSENLTPEHICNENTSDYTKMTDETETETVTDELDRGTIPTTMLTPPPTGEPLLNGSSRSSTSGNDLQQFTADGIMQPSPELSPQADDGNSNQSENSDSADSKLIINEGSIDSNDIADVNRTKNEPTAEIQQNMDDDEECSERPHGGVDTNQTDEMLCETNSVADQVIPDEVITVSELDSRDEHKQSPIQSDSITKPHESDDETSQNVPSQSINGIVQPVDNFESLTPECENEDRLANESHTEHRKLKRKLSDSNSDTYENPHKQTKFHNQTDSIELIDNQTDVADSVPNHVVNHNQMSDKCDNSMHFDISNSRDAPITLAKSQMCADENFESEPTLDEPSPVTTKENTDTDEFGHKYMNGHMSSKTETIQQQAPLEYKHQITTFNATNDLNDKELSPGLNAKTKLLSPQPNENNVMSDSNDIKSDVYPEPDRIETSFLSDRLDDESHEPEQFEPANSSPSNFKPIPSNYNSVSDVLTKNNSCSSDSSAHFSNVTTTCNSQSLDLAKETAMQPQQQQHQAHSTIIPYKQQHQPQQQQQQHDNKRSNTHFRIRRQVFMCSACGTYFEKWNLFYHIREVHNKFICLFENCLGIFPNAERLVIHLESKHVRKPYVYEHRDDLLRSLRNQCFLMCCDCEHIFTENDDVTAHSCELFKKPCLVCGLKSHRSNCSALLSSKSSKHKQKRAVAPPNPIQPMMPSPNIGHSANNITQQTFLRNALLCQEPRLQPYVHPDIAQAPTFDHRLNNLPQPLPPTPHPQTQSQLQLQLQTQTQLPAAPLPMSSINGNIAQHPMVRFTLLPPLIRIADKSINRNTFINLKFHSFRFQSSL